MATLSTATTANASSKLALTVARPGWANELSEKYRAGMAHAFILHGNVQDYVAGVPGQNLRDYLISSFADRDVIVVYNRSSGFYFPSSQHRLRFKQVTGLSEEVSASAGVANRGGGTGLAGALNSMLTADNGDTALEQIGRQPGAALQLLTKLLRYKPQPQSGATGAGANPGFRAAVILDYAETLAPASGGSASTSENDRTAFVTLAEWGRDPLIAGQDGLIALVVSEVQALHEGLCKSGARWEQIEIPLPTLQQRANFATLLIFAPTTLPGGGREGHQAEAENEADEEVRLEAGFSYEELARLTNGLRLIDIEDITLKAAFSGQPVSKELVKGRKAEIVAGEFDDVLSIVESEQGFATLGGLAEVKEALAEYVIAPMRSGQYRLVPQGILLMGPAGTGKSRIAKALAKECGFTFVELAPSKIFSKWVGDTERRLEKALTAIRQAAPCIVFIDEIDQSVSRGENGGNDSGVSSRVFKRLMEVMADTSLRGRVLWIGATNRPDLLDAALLRPGRFDEKIPVLAPDTQERAAILEVLTEQAFTASSAVWSNTSGSNPGLALALAPVWPDPPTYLALAGEMAGYTGAEIELVVSKAVKLFAKGIVVGSTLALTVKENARSGAAVATMTLTIAQALEQALERIIPTTQDVQAMTDLALLHCSDLDLVPQLYREQARQLRQRKQSRQHEDFGTAFSNSSSGGEFELASHEVTATRRKTRRRD